MHEVNIFSSSVNLERVGDTAPSTVKSQLGGCLGIPAGLAALACSQLLLHLLHLHVIHEVILLVFSLQFLYILSHKLPQHHVDRMLRVQLLLVMRQRVLRRLSHRRVRGRGVQLGSERRVGRRSGGDGEGKHSCPVVVEGRLACCCDRGRRQEEDRSADKQHSTRPLPALRPAPSLLRRFPPPLLPVCSLRPAPGCNVRQREIDLRTDCPAPVSPSSLTHRV
mmetsp:Transcript_4305/g.10433  ORF Transcript_4305/g.10433 Transcript_4305/m.10433 type:complete len:222 (+) Transcript_4305:927-1592(+)